MHAGPRASSCAEGFQWGGGRSEARPLIAVFGMSAATKQNGKLIDSCRGPEEKAGGGVCVYVCVYLCMYLCLSACVSMSYEEQLKDQRLLTVCASTADSGHSGGPLPSESPGVAIRDQ